MLSSALCQVNTGKLIFCLKVGKLRFGGIYADFKGNILCFTWLNISLLQGKVALQTHSFPLGKFWLFFSPAAVQIKMKRVTCFGFRLELNEEKAPLLGLLQPLLVFPLQRDRSGMDTLHLTVTGTAGGGSEVPPCCRHRRLQKNSMKWKYQHTSKAKLLPLSTQGWLARSHP